MPSGRFVVASVAPQCTHEVTFAQYNRVILTFPADRVDDQCGVRVLSRRSGSSWNFVDVECCSLPAGLRAADAICNSDQVTGRFIGSADLPELPRRPKRRWALGDIEAQK